MRLDLDTWAIFGCNIAKWTILCIVVHFQPVITLLQKGVRVHHRRVILMQKCKTLLHFHSRLDSKIGVIPQHRWHSQYMPVGLSDSFFVPCIPTKTVNLGNGNFREFFRWRGGGLSFQNWNSRWPCQGETKFRYFVCEERSKAVCESTGWSGSR